MSGLAALAAAGLLAVGGGAAVAAPGSPTASPTDPNMVVGFDATTMDPISDADLRDSVRRIPLDEVSVIDLSGSVRPWAEPKQQDDGTTVVTISTDILFDFGLSEIDADGKRAIAEAVKAVSTGTSIDVTGYTDSLGGDEVNGPLSQARADAVAAIIRDERPDLVVTAEGRGSADAVAPNTNPDGTDNPEGRAQNRRVEIRYG